MIDRAGQTHDTLGDESSDAAWAHVPDDNDKMQAEPRNKRSAVGRRRRRREEEDAMQQAAAFFFPRCDSTLTKITV